MSVDLALFNADGSTRTWEDVLASVQAAADGNRSSLRLGGPEPTRSPDLLRAIEACRSAGLAVELETDAAVLAGEGRAQLLRAAGLSRLHVKLWGCSPATHDARAGAGSLKRTLQGVRAGRQAGLEVQLSFGLNRLNASELSRAVELAGSLRTQSLVLERDPAVDLPTAAEFAEAVNRAVEAGQKPGVSLSPIGLPQISCDVVWKLHSHTFDAGVLALLDADLVERPRPPLFAVGAQGVANAFLEQATAAGGVRQLCRTLEAAGAPLVDLPLCLGGSSTPRPERAAAEHFKHERCLDCAYQTSCPGADAQLGKAVRAELGPRRDWLKRPREGRIELIGFNDPEQFERDWTFPDLARQLEALGLEVAFRDVASASENGHASLYVFPDYAQLSKNYELVQRNDSSAVVLDFHMLRGIQELRARCGLPAMQPGRRQIESDLDDRLPAKLTIVSCFPGYTKLYRNAGVPLERVTWNPYSVSLTNLPDALPVTQATTFSCGGNHLRDWPTFFESMRLFKPRHRLEAYGQSEIAAVDSRVGSLPLRDFWAALARSRFLVVPLDPDWARPAGITVMTMAQAVGRPIIATRTPATEDHLRHGEDALLVPARDPRALADAIALLDTNDAECERLAAGARRAAEKASTAALARLLVQGSQPLRRSGASPSHVW